MNVLLTNIRESLQSNKPFVLEKNTIYFDEKISQIYITLYQDGINSIRWGSRKENLQVTIERIIFKLKHNLNFHKFNIQSQSKCRIMFEIVTNESACNIKNLTTMNMESKNRFEPGVNGLKYRYKGLTRFFMPSEGYTKSIMSVQQLLNYLSKQCGIAKKTNKISERVHLMRREPIEFTFIESKAYVTYEDQTLELERGYPKSELNFSKDIMYDKTIKSVNWLVENMNEDGSFLYYYDPYLNTVVDDVHPKMIDPLYNNILRHSGGTVSLIRGYELSGNKLYLEKAKDSIDFLLSTFKIHKYKKEFACYPFFNKKSKLGGAGIGLVAIMHYYIKTGDECYRKELDGLVRHILSRVDKNGEMLGYYIHPLHNEGKALINPNDDVKKELFSFYYPGEALLGLALYYLHIKNIDEDLKQDIKIKSEIALDFLVDIRPIKYDYMFDSLPADAWLMQAIEEWVKVDGFKKKSYIDFVFNDTKAMFDHMYTEENTLKSNKDYIGGFYYEYGDHVYHDASRCEGVVSAYYLAKYLKDDDKASWIMQNMLLSAKGLMKTFHDEKSVYAHKNQKKAMNSFRFKLTRQWVRVDSVQHAACFFSRLIPIIKDDSDVLIDNKYKIIDLIDEAGYSKVYRIQDIDNSRFYALKLMKESRYINLIEDEYKALKIMNKISNIKFHKAGKFNNDVYFLFDLAKDGNLKQFVQKNGILDESVIYDFLRAMLKTLTFAKEHKLLHLDLKPANVLYNEEKFTLSDWGNSKNVECANSIHLKGNPIYIAPEFYQGRRSFESDIYSLGCSLYFLLTSNHIFNLRKRYSLVQKVYSHICFTPNLSKIKSNKMKYLVSRMLDKNTQTRIKLNEIEEVLNNTSANYKFDENKNENEIVDFDNEYKLYEKMANDNIPFAQDKFARYFLESDIDNAIYWLQKASDNGYARAQNKLAYIYFNEKFNRQDTKKAFFYFQKAADQNQDMALYYIGLMYSDGIQIKKNEETALTYFIESAKNAYRPAYKKLKELNKKIDVNINLYSNEILLQSSNLLEVTGGYWENLDKPIVIKGLNYHQKSVEQGDLFITSTPQQWEERKVSNEEDINKAIKNGAVALMLREESTVKTNYPTLRVKDTKKALKKIALKTSQITKAKKVLVTGSYGKTGFKVQLNNIIKNQVNTNAVLNSANQSVGIFKALSCIRKDDEVAIIEVAVPSDKGAKRASYIKPDICVITSIGHEHIEKHKTIEKLVKHKTSVVSALKPNGFVIIPRDDQYYNLIIENLKNYKDINILTFGSTDGCNAQLLEANFNDFGWDIKAKIENTILTYRINFLESYAPTNSLAPLLCASYLGLNVEEAASNYKNTDNYKSSGILYKLNDKDIKFMFYDQSYRGGIESFIEFFKTIALVKPKNNGKKIVITSEFVDYKDGEMENINTTLFQELIEKANIDLYFSVEKFKKHDNVLDNTSVKNIYKEKFEDIENKLFSTISNHDIVFIKGIYESDLPELSKKIRLKYDGVNSE